MTSPRQPTDETIALVLGAAVAAAADRSAAEDATLRVFAAAGPDAAPERLAATAVRLALRAAPAAAFAGMAVADAEAVALTRLLRLREGRVAALLGVSPREVRRRLLSGLSSALPEAACA